MKSIRRIGIVILLLGLTYIMRAIQPDWEQMARDNFYAVVANSWLFKLAALFVAGLLSYLMVYDMTRREKLYWSMGLLVVVACIYLLTRPGNEYAFLYIGISPNATTTITFLAAFLLADWFRTRPGEKKNNN